MTSRLATLGITLLLLLVTTATAPRVPIDPDLAACIATVRAIDNHVHPMRPIPFGSSAPFIGTRKGVGLARRKERIHERYAHQRQ